MSKHRTQQEWIDILESAARSDLSVSEFCRQNRIAFPKICFTGIPSNTDIPAMVKEHRNGSMPLPMLPVSQSRLITLRLFLYLHRLYRWH